MDNTSEIITSNEIHSGLEWIQILESTFGEGYSSSRQKAREGSINMFGRPVHFHTSDSMAWTAGLASSGLRAAVMLEGDELLRNAQEIRSAVRNRLAIVVHTTSRHLARDQYSADYERQAYYSLSNSGVIQLYSSNSQEVIDFCLIAHKLAELTLLPVVHGMDAKPLGYGSFRATIPARADMKAFLGDPDDMIPSPTPAQKLIFGEERRRIPNWFHFDLPQSGGMRKDGQSMALEAAAGARYFQDAVHDVLSDVLEEFGKMTGRKYSPITEYHAEDASHLFLVQGSAWAETCSAVDSLRKNRKARLGSLNLSLMQPIAGDMLLNVLGKCKALTILEPISGSAVGAAPLKMAVSSILSAGSKSNIRIYSGLYGDDLSEDVLSLAYDNMLKGDKGRSQVYLGLSFSRRQSDFPKHEVLLQSISRAYPGIEEESLEVRPASNLDGPVKDKDICTIHSAPLIERVRSVKDLGPPYSSLSRFQDHSAMFYREKITDEMVADPFQALSSAPSASALLVPSLKKGDVVPVFNAADCTGCGKCVSNCPDSALPALAISPELIIRKGIDLITSDGYQVRQITPLVKGWAKLASRFIRETDTEVHVSREMLSSSFDNLVAQASMTGDKEVQTRAEAEAIINKVGDLPIAKTDPFFTEADDTEKGSGSLFSLALDPQTCTACGLCMAVCPEGALIPKVLDSTLYDQLTSNYQLWEKMPDTDPQIIKRLVENEEYDPFAASMLNRKVYRSVSGGVQSTSTAGSKTAVRTLLAGVESLVQTRHAEQLTIVRERIEGLSSAIRKTLTDSLPLHELDHWASVLSDSSLNRVSIVELTSRLDDLAHMKPLETEPVKRKLALLNELRDLENVLGVGPTGMGRSRYGMLIPMSDSVSWSSIYPTNPFSSPSILDWSEQPAEKLLGLIQAHMRHGLDNLKLLRRAALEAKGKYEPRIHDQEISMLDWMDLNEAEKNFLSPIWMVGDASSVTDKNLGQLQQLLGTQWPIRICVLNDCIPDNDQHAASLLMRRNANLMSLMAMQNAFILQGSTAGPRQLFDGLASALDHSGPSLIMLFAPDPKRHTIVGRDWSGLADLALNTRAFPMAVYQPAESRSELLSANLSILDNPFSDQKWTNRQIAYRDGDEIGYHEYQPTYADWLFSLKDWQEHFQLLEDELEKPVGVSEYASLAQAERKGLVPVITRANEKGDLIHYRVSEEVIDIVAVALQNWNTLRDMAGMLTPFPEKLEKKVRAELSVEFEKKAKELEADFQRQKEKIEQDHLDAVHRQLSDKLLVLSQSKTEV